MAVGRSRLVWLFLSSIIVFSSFDTVMGDRKSVIIRLFLVRHGQTEANVQRLVVGQSHSPLTKMGMEQARALGRTSWIRDAVFWRMYASDLQRAQDTAHLLLTSANESLETLLLDNRLREISKGARQGYPLSFTYTEALQERRNNQNSDLDNPIHKLETEDEGWERIQNWLNDVVREAVVTAQLNESHDTTAVEQQEQQQPLTVLAVAHAGIYRIFLRRLIGDDRLFAHPAASFDPIDGRFAIPNTSLTVLNVTATLNDKGEPEPIAAGHEQVDIVQLTWRGHTQDEQETVKEDETTTHTTL